MTGFSVAGSSLGGVVWPTVMEQLFLNAKLSFGWSFRIVGFTMLPLFAIVLATVKPPVKVPQEKSEGGTEAAATESKKKKKTKDLTALRKPPFVLLCAGLGVSFFGMWRDTDRWNAEFEAQG